MRTFATCMVVAVCALTSTTQAQAELKQTLTVLAQDPHAPAPGGTRTPNEYGVCWNDRPDPSCLENQYLDRSGLIGVTPSQDFCDTSATTPCADTDNTDFCVCRKLPTECPEGFIWDYLNENCQCVQESDCAANYYFDYNVCACQCEPQTSAGCVTNFGSNYYWSENSCSCKCHPDANQPTVNADHTTTTWNGFSCSWDVVEDPADPCSNLDGSGLQYYFSVLEEACIYLGMMCGPNQYFDSGVGECICSHQNCGPNEYFDNDPDTCYCRCKPMVCDTGYVFNNVQCECDCLEESAEVPCGQGYFWSTENCQCECRTPVDFLGCDPGFYWDTSSCACACAPEECLEDHYQWNFATCECECCPSSLCGPGDYFNTVTCRCEQEPQACATGFFWYVKENGDGECVVAPTSCAPGEAWSFNYERCVCIEFECNDLGTNGQPMFFDQLADPCECRCTPDASNPCSAETDPLDVDAEFYFNSLPSVCACEKKPRNCGSMSLYYDATAEECVCRPQVCGHDEIFDYEECICRCKPEQCPVGMFWSENQCDCRCEKLDIDCGADKHFDDHLCECVCTETGTAPNAEDYFWSHYYCAFLCAPKDLDAVNHADEYFNTDSCRWECNIEDCPVGFFFRIGDDGTGCSCVCLPHECAEGQYWNYDSCCCNCLEEACPVNTEWDVAKCACVCTPDVSCNAATEYWNTENCSCDCKNDGDCPAHPLSSRAQVFNYDSCACECLYPDATEAATESTLNLFSFDECDWVLKPQDCDVTEYWDPVGDVCLCRGQVCPSPYAWDSTDCNCQCNDAQASPDSEAYTAKTACEAQDGTEWNAARCECQICEPQVCPDFNLSGTDYPQFWNPNCCSCQCIPYLDCVDGFDFDNCACVVLV